MVVDDDDDIREVLAFTLHNYGFEVVQAVHGRAALELILARGLPALILLDMNMPVMNGWELARELRERGLTSCPIVVFTATHDAQRIVEEIGAVGFVKKPFELESLLCTIRKWRSSPGNISGAGDG